MNHCLQDGRFEFAGVVVEVGEDIQTRLTQLTVTLPGGQAFRAYFNGRGEPVQPSDRDNLAGMLSELKISPAVLEPLSPD
jgi:hypothetical protein